MDEKKDKKILAKVICVILSFALWFYVTNVVNPTTSRTIKNVSIQILNEEELASKGLALSPNQELKVDVKVEGHFNKVKNLTSKDFTLVIDLGKNADESGKYTIPVSIIDQPDEITIINEDSLETTINVEELITRQYNLINNVEITYSNNYSGNNVYIEPLHINVSGPKTLVNKVEKVVLEGKADNISSEIEKEFPIKPYDKDGNIVSGVTLDYDKGLLNISINKRKSVPIKVKYANNLPEGVELIEAVLSIEKTYVSAENTLIDDIQEIETQPIDLSNIYSDTSIESNLIIPSGVESSNSKVSVSIKVVDNRIITKTFKDVGVNYLNKNSNLEYSISGVDVVIKGKEEDLEKVTVDNIKVEASVESIVEAGENNNIQWTATLVGVDNVEIENKTGVVSINVSKQT